MALPPAPPLRRSTLVGAVMLVLLGLAYAVFMVAAAFSPGRFAGPVFPGGTVSLWFLYGIGLIWSVVLATGVFVLLANAEEAGQ